MNQQYVYQSQKHGFVTTTNNNQLQNFYSGNQNTSIAKFVDASDALANGQYALAVSKNNSISPANTVQQKTKRINELMYKVQADPYYMYSPSELQDLNAIASECSVKGWYVVQARNILTAISNDVLYFEDNCDETKSGSRIAASEETPVVAEKQPEFNLYPNPSKGIMTLSYNLASASKGVMQLIDVTGKLINEYTMQESTGTIEINEENLRNGIYFYRILVNEKIIKTDKVVIIK